MEDGRRNSTDLVKNVFDIDIDLMYTKTAGNAYWASCEHFFEEKANTPVCRLSIKQFDWFLKIEKGLKE